MKTNTSVGKLAPFVGKTLTSVDKTLTSVSKILTSVGKILTSVGKFFTFVDKTITSVVKIFTSVGKLLTSVGKTITSVGKLFTSVGKFFTSVGIEYSFSITYKNTRFSFKLYYPISTLFSTPYFPLFSNCSSNFPTFALNNKMNPIIDHIQITVKELTIAEPFYDKLLPILGFDLNRKSKGRVANHDFDVVEYFHPLLTFGINSPREAFKKDTIHRRKPGALHHLAFKATSRAEVDELYPKIKETGANIIEPPKFYPQHGESYYALFFKDLEGIKYEIVYEERKP